jgi:hypothetical protein
MVTRDEDPGPVDKVDEGAEVLEGQITRRDHEVDPDRRGPSHTEVGNLLVTDCQRPDHNGNATFRNYRRGGRRWRPSSRPKRCCPKQVQASMPVRTGDLQEGVSRACGPEGGEARRRDQARTKLRLEGKPRSRQRHTVRRRTGPAHRRLFEDRDPGAVAAPTSSKLRPTSDTRDAKTTMREVGSTTYDWTRLGLKIGRLALGCMSYGNPATPSSKVVTKEVVTTEN